MLSDGQVLQDDAAVDISTLTWEVTIEREVAKVEGALGFASLTDDVGEGRYLNAGYRADPAAFDRLDHLLASGVPGVQLQFHIEGMRRLQGEKIVRWNAGRFGSPVQAVHATRDY